MGRADLLRLAVVAFGLSAGAAAVEAAGLPFWVNAAAFVLALILLRAAFVRLGAPLASDPEDDDASGAGVPRDEEPQDEALLDDNPLRSSLRRNNPAEGP